MSGRQGFRDLLSELQQVKDNNTDAVFEKIQARYDIRYQAYINISLTAGNLSLLDLLHTFPKPFIRHYREKNLFAIDPVMQSALTGIKPVDWRERHLSDPATGRVFMIAARYGITDIGMTIPLLCRGNQTALFALNADMTPHQWERRRFGILRDMQVLATYLAGKKVFGE